MRDKVFYLGCFGFVFGVLLRSFMYVNFYFSVFLALLCLILILVSFLVFKNKILTLVFCFLLAFSLGVLRFSASDVPVPEIAGDKLSGIIADEPDIRENNQKLTVQILAPQC